MGIQSSSKQQKLLRVKTTLRGNPSFPDDYIVTWDSIQSGDQNAIFMSCSDKIAMWNVVGVQGALLSFFLEPIYIQSLVVTELFHHDHIVRAVWGRVDQSLLAAKMQKKNVPKVFGLNCHQVETYKPAITDEVFKSNVSIFKVFFV